MPVKDRKVILVILSVVIPALAAMFIMSNYAMVEGYVKRHYAENMLFDCYMDSGIMEYIAFCCAFWHFLRWCFRCAGFWKPLSPSVPFSPCHRKGLL